MSPPSLLLVTSNGTGMGHLARQLAIALAAEGRSSLLSTSAALPAVTSLGVNGEYCPGPDRDWIPEQPWAQYLAARIELVARELAADVVVFDGVAPYRGVTLAKTRMPELPFVWFRRGLWRRDTNAGQLWKSGLFDAVIEPGDLASGADVGPTASRDDALRVPPVTLIDVVAPMGRPDAAASLGLDPDMKTMLITLGTGRLGDVSEPGSVIMEAVLDRSDWQIGVVTSSIARLEIPTVAQSRVVPIRGVFPLVRYLEAFDAAVSAAGYNSVHELIPGGLPTLLVPNTATRTDDQLTRAAEVARRGLALTANPSSREDLRQGIDELLDDESRDRLGKAIAAIPTEHKSGGAVRTAAALARLAVDHVPTRLTLGQQLLRARDDAKDAVKRALGPQATNQVRRLLGRPPLDTSEMLDVSIGAAREGTRELRFMDSPLTQDLLGDAPVEHLLPGATATYQAERELLAHRFYNVIDPG